MKNFYTLLFVSLLAFSTSDLLAKTAPCSLVGAVVTVPYSAPPIMMNATVNGMSQYTYDWNDGTPVGSSNQKPFYSGWCVTITDIMTGCDTIICESCIPTGGVGICTMQYDPVCGCDGNVYSNDCMAMQQGIFTYTSTLGGTVPCTLILPSWECGPSGCYNPGTGNGQYPTPSACLADSCNVMPPPPCDVEITGDSIVCEDNSAQVLTAVPTGNGTPPYTYLWGSGQSNISMGIGGTGTYCVTVTDANGCVASACFTVDIEDIVIYSTPSPAIICLGDTIALEFWNTPLTNIVWMPTGDTIHMIHDNPNISTTYIVEGIGVNGCDRRGEILVTVDSCTNIPPSWDCVGNACVDFGTGLGMYPTLAACDNVCLVNAVEEHTTNKKLLKITDLLGRETKGFKNDVLFYIYDDGTVEKRIVIE